MSFIVVTRNPRSKKLIVIGDDDVPAEWDDESKAAVAASEIPICRAWGYDVIEVPTSTD